jgi:hypothetical protein
MRNGEQVKVGQFYLGDPGQFSIGANTIDQKWRQGRGLRPENSTQAPSIQGLGSATSSTPALPKPLR